MDIKNCRVVFFLADDDSKAIKRIQIITAEFQWIDTAKIIAQSTTTAYPKQQTDLRHAIFLLGVAQESKQVFSKHIGEYRKSVLVQYYPPLKVKMTFRNGLSVSLQATEAYPMVRILVYCSSLLANPLTITCLIDSWCNPSHQYLAYFLLARRLDIDQPHATSQRSRILSIIRLVQFH